MNLGVNLTYPNNALYFFLFLLAVDLPLCCFDKLSPRMVKILPPEARKYIQ
jgi:hypothetical protein